MRHRRVASLALREWGDPAEPGVLLWPGLGATAAYFDSLARELPGRAVSIDPPGYGASAPLDPCTHSRTVQIASAVVDECGCHAIVGHSLGAYVAASVAADPPAGLRAAVLIDGGFMEAEERAQLGMPITAGRTELVRWLTDNALRFPDWESATRELAAMISSDETQALRAYLRELLIEVDGEIRERATPDQDADLLLAALDHAIRPVADTVSVPTLLIACGQPAEHRAIKERAWQAFAARSPLIELHVAEDWGHNPLFQAPEAFSELIVGWLRQNAGL